MLILVLLYFYALALCQEHSNLVGSFVQAFQLTAATYFHRPLGLSVSDYLASVPQKLLVAPEHSLSRS